MPLFRLRFCLAKTLTFSNFSVISEEIYSKLRLNILLSKGEPVLEGQVIFFDIVMPHYFYLEFSKSSCSRALAPACAAFVIFEIKSQFAKIHIYN